MQIKFSNDWQYRPRPESNSQPDGSTMTAIRLDTIALQGPAWRTIYSIVQAHQKLSVWLKGRLDGMI